MADVKIIKIQKCPDKWMQLLLYLQNSPQTSFRIEFPTKEKAAYARDKMRRTLYSRDEWFSLLITAHGSDVYVINMNRVQKARVLYE